MKIETWQLEGRKEKMKLRVIISAEGREDFEKKVEEFTSNPALFIIPQGITFQRNVYYRRLAGVFVDELVESFTAFIFYTENI
jgi:hypothetical protein